MTFTRLLVAAFLLMAAPASADQPLVGTDGNGRVRVLDPDLNIVPGTPALPASTDATVLSPDGRRFASWAFTHTRLTIRNRRTFKAITTRRVEQGTEVFWLTPNRIVTVAYVPGDGYVKRPNIIRSFDLEDGTTRTLRLPGIARDVQRVGDVIRLLTVGGPNLAVASGPWVVTDIGARGVVKRRWRVPLPDGINAHAGMRLSGTLLLATKNRKHALIRIHSGRTRRLTGLPNGFYAWVGRHFIAAGGHVARVDRRAMRVTATVDTRIDDTATPFRGGFIMGFGRARYDANLRRVAENPTPAPTQGFAPVLANDRLYDLVVDCEGPDTRMAIADATTGAAIAERPGRWRFGVLGGGYFNQPWFDDVCD
jgi:hypothetical protein